LLGETAFRSWAGRRADRADLPARWPWDRLGWGVCCCAGASSSPHLAAASAA